MNQLIKVVARIAAASLRCSRLTELLYTGIHDPTQLQPLNTINKFPCVYSGLRRTHIDNRAVVLSI